MKSYTPVEVSEQRLEGLVRSHCGMIEEGLIYADHQKQVASGRLDVLMVDSGKSLVVAELKITQDDSMLMQALDYYDYVSSHVEAYGRLYANVGVDPTQPVRLLLIAPSFSQALVNRCKWIGPRISLFAYRCLRFEGDDDLVPVFWEQDVPALSVSPENVTTEKHLCYITDPEVRGKARVLLDEVRAWKPEGITLDAIKDSVSIKVNNRVFAYFEPRRKHYLLWTYGDQEELAVYAIKSDADLAMVKPFLMAAMERKAKC